MKALGICSDIWQLERAQWRDRDWLRRLQERKLQALVEHAYRTVPFYRARLNEAGISPRDIRSCNDLARIPITTRAALQASSVDDRTSSAFRQDQLVATLTSGSTGRPFAIYRDPKAMRLRKALFLRALRATGYRFGDRLLLFIYPPKSQPPAWLRWRYVTRDVPVEEHLHALNAFRPSIIYAMATTLWQLAVYIRSTGRSAHRPRTVISTGETLDGAKRSVLEETFGAAVFDVYGAVETGTMAWECRHHAGLHIAEDIVIVELLVSPHDDVLRMVLTNLVNLGMPQIRYEIGDLAVLADDGPCACGRSFRRIARIDGRLIDCVRLASGRLISPYRFERQIERIPGVQRFQVVQDRDDQLLVRLEGAREDSVAAAVRAAAEEIVGPGVIVRIRWEVSLDPPLGEKFRLVRCHLPAASS